MTRLVSPIERASRLRNLQQERQQDDRRRAIIQQEEVDEIHALGQTKAGKKLVASLETKEKSALDSWLACSSKDPDFYARSIKAHAEIQHGRALIRLFTQPDRPQAEETEEDA